MARKVIFISSHYASLKNQRVALKASLEAQKYKVILVESEGSTAQSPFRTCLNGIERSDLVILILGNQYGKTLQGSKKSMTELEYDHARSLTRPVLLFKVNFENDYEEKQLKFITRVEHQKKGLSRGRTISSDDDLYRRVLNDVKNHFKGGSQADQLVPIPTNSGRIVKFGEFFKHRFPESIDISTNPIISIRARLNYTHEAGHTHIVQLSLNDYEFDEKDLVNKPNKLVMGDRREFFWYDNVLRSWALVYSPDFKSNYSNAGYKITNGDAYTFMFSTKNVPLKKKGNLLKIMHSGNGGYEDQKNAIIVSHYEIIP